MRCLPVAAALLTFTASGASALPNMGIGTPAVSATPAAASNHQHYRKAIAIRALRREGLAVQAADGGTLTQEHRAELQSKLDKILAGNY